MTAPTILVVEDSETIRQLVVGFLTNLGHRMIEAEDMITATAIARTERAAGREIDVILCDLILPGPNGLEVTAAVVELHPDAAVVLMSGEGLPPGAALPQGSEFLSKPFKLSGLRAAVTAALA